MAGKIKRSSIEKVRYVVGRNSEIAEAEKQIRPNHTSRACSTGNVVLSLSADSNRIANLGMQTGRRDWRHGLCVIRAYYVWQNIQENKRSYQIDDREEGRVH